MIVWLDYLFLCLVCVFACEVEQACVWWRDEFLKRRIDQRRRHLMVEISTDRMANAVFSAITFHNFPPTFRAPLAEAFLQHLTHQTTSAIFTTDAAHVAEAHRVASLCPEGWPGIISGKCTLR